MHKVFSAFATGCPSFLEVQQNGHHTHRHLHLHAPREERAASPRQSESFDRDGPPRPLLTSFSESTGFHPCCHRYLQAGTHLLCEVTGLSSSVGHSPSLANHPHWASFGPAFSQEMSSTPQRQHRSGRDCWHGVYAGTHLCLVLCRLDRKARRMPWFSPRLARRTPLLLALLAGTNHPQNVRHPQRGLACSLHLVA